MKKKLFMRITALTAFLFLTVSSTAQTITQPPCSSTHASEFDFWIGEWIATWNDSLHAVNCIEKMFGNCTVHENFINAKTNYLGQSWSVYNAANGLWNQTWVDNQGAYIALSGGMRGDSMILVTAGRDVPRSISPTGKIVSRMVYYNIAANAFDWSWQSSTDGGITWKNNWQIHYVRK